MFRKSIRKHIVSGYYQMKGIGYFVLIPMTVLYLLIPLSNYAVYHFWGDLDMLYSNIIMVCQYMCPIFSVWYVFFILYHYVEVPGNEIFYVEGKNKISELIFPYTLYLILMLPLFVIYTRLFSDLWWLYFKLCIVNLLYVAITYSITFLTKKILLSVIVILLYTMLVIAENTFGWEMISYYNAFLYTGLALCKELLPLFIASLLLFAVGSIGNHYYY